MKKKEMKLEFDIDKVITFINLYIYHILFVVVAILLFSIILIFNSSKKNKNRDKLLVQYYKYINSSNEKDKVISDLLNIYNSKQADNTIKVITGIKIADYYLSINKVNEALLMYKNVYNLKNIDEFIKNLAGLSILNILINQEGNKNYNEIDNFITEISKKDNPLITLVKEQEAMYQIQKGDIDKGLKILKDLLIQNDLDDEAKKRSKLIINLYQNENI